MPAAILLSTECGVECHALSPWVIKKDKALGTLFAFQTLSLQKMLPAVREWSRGPAPARVHTPCLCPINCQHILPQCRALGTAAEGQAQAGSQSSSTTQLSLRNKGVKGTGKLKRRKGRKRRKKMMELLGNGRAEAAVQQVGLVPRRRAGPLAPCISCISCRGLLVTACARRAVARFPSSPPVSPHHARHCCLP